MLQQNMIESDCLFMKIKYFGLMNANNMIFQMRLFDFRCGLEHMHPKISIKLVGMKKSL